MIGRLEIPGGWMWSAWQPDRGMAFNSYLFERDGGAVAIDPLPLEERELDDLAARVGPVHTIVLTNRDHARAAGVLRERFGSRILAHAPEASLFELPIDATFEDREEIFPGAFALAIPCGKTPGETAIVLPAARAAIVGDAIIGAPAGSLSLLPDEKLADPSGLVLALRRLWARDLEALLLGDGQPLFTGADAALGRLLESRGGPAVNRINVDEIAFVRDASDPDRYQVEDGEVGLLIGARKLGYRLARIEAGRAFCPLHSHVHAEEFFFVLEGTPSIRTLTGTIECRSGDFIAFPTGERGTHQVRNDSGQSALVLLVGMEPDAEVCFYPDSRKVLVDVRGESSVMVRSVPLLDYYDGE